jgi:hypothetical protein
MRDQNEVHLLPFNAGRLEPIQIWRVEMVEDFLRPRLAVADSVSTRIVKSGVLTTQLWTLVAKWSPATGGAIGPAPAGRSGV